MKPSENPSEPLFINADQLREIRENTDWRRLFQALRLQKDPKQGNDNDWWASSPLAEDGTASFHINDKGWFCFSTHQGGGVVELVQAAEAARGNRLNCYEAGRWLLDAGCAHLRDGGHITARETAIPTAKDFRGEGKKKERPPDNPPIRQNLVPALDPEYPGFRERGVSADTCRFLSAGYLPPARSKSRLAGRMVFQVRGLQKTDNGLKSVILSHIGRATTDEQKETDGKWNTYGGFSKTLELYNLDKAVLDDRARAQARQTGHYLVVEGCFDVAKLAEAKIFNVVATFGSHLDEYQIPRLEQLATQAGIHRFRLWYDRDPAGRDGHAKAIELTATHPRIELETFDWNLSFPSPDRGAIPIPETLGDVCDFSVEQLRWLRQNGII